MIKKKLCMVGSFAVGKTSLVSRFVKSVFSDKYHTSVGVKVDKKDLTIDGQDVNLMIWDLAGEDDFQQLKISYIKGSSAYLLVCDGTRRASYDKSLELKQRIEDELGPLPFCLLVNKCDLKKDWEVSDQELSALEAQGWTVLQTSAKSGDHVEAAFETLARKTLKS